jgi:hypothetical protein
MTSDETRFEVLASDPSFDSLPNTWKGLTFSLPYAVVVECNGVELGHLLLQFQQHTPPMRTHFSLMTDQKYPILYLVNQLSHAADSLYHLEPKVAASAERDRKLTASLPAQRFPAAL